MKVLVCGSRDYSDIDAFAEAMTVLSTQRGPFTQIIEGEARGADSMAREWGKLNGIPVAKYPANWRKFGKAAGPIRNKRMLDEGKPDLVVAFPSNGLANSKGTKNMVTQAKAAGIETIVIEE